MRFKVLPYIKQDLVLNPHILGEDIFCSKRPLLIKNSSKHIKVSQRYTNHYLFLFPGKVWWDARSPLKISTRAERQHSLKLETVSSDVFSFFHNVFQIPQVGADRGGEY